MRALNTGRYKEVAIFAHYITFRLLQQTTAVVKSPLLIMLVAGVCLQHLAM